MGGDAVILLDTHVMIWSATDDARLGAKGRSMINKCDQSDPFHVSAISAWEIAMLVRKGRIDLGEPAWTWFAKASNHPAWQTIPLDAQVAMDAVNLPGDMHGDPADRFLVATARHQGYSILTADRAILDYAAGGHVKAVDAAR
jgi:PIN domain nuclease of toxin-antitoxin system